MQKLYIFIFPPPFTFLVSQLTSFYIVYSLTNYCIRRGFFFLIWLPVSYGVHRPGIRSKQDRLQLWQHQILNPLCWAGDQTCIPALPRCLWPCATAGTAENSQFKSGICSQKILISKKLNPLFSGKMVTPFWILSWRYMSHTEKYLAHRSVCPGDAAPHLQE